MTVNGLKVVFRYGDDKSTTCKIFKNEELVSEGKAGLFYKDLQFIKLIGRKVSLMKAVKGLTSKEDRAVVWEMNPKLKHSIFYKVGKQTFKV
jgi:hypothetical protein